MCLQDRLGGLRALTEVFANASAEVVENAVSAANALALRSIGAPMCHCFGAVMAPPEDPETRGSVHEPSHPPCRYKGELRRRSLEAVGLANTPVLAKEARSLGYKPLIAEASCCGATFFLKAGEAARRGEGSDGRRSGWRTRPGTTKFVQRRRRNWYS